MNLKSFVLIFGFLSAVLVVAELVIGQLMAAGQTWTISHEYVGILTFSTTLVHIAWSLAFAVVTLVYIACSLAFIVSIDPTSSVELPAGVSSAKATLEPEMQKAFVRDYASRKKSLVVAYVTWLLLGWHYLYLGKIGLQFAFWFTGGGLLVWWLFDFFRMPGVVARRNEDMAREMMVQYKLMGGESK